MISRAVVLIALAAFLFTGTVYAGDEPKLPGSNLTIEDAVAKSDAVFKGQLTDLGEKDRNAGDHLTSGPEYDSAQVKVAQTWKGTVDAQISVGIFPYDDPMHRETTPKVGESYIFFVEKSEGTAAPFRALKILPATHDNMTAAIVAILKAKTHAKLLEIQKEKKQGSASGSN
jgi:hypothetical protein